MAKFINFVFAICVLAAVGIKFPSKSNAEANIKAHGLPKALVSPKPGECDCLNWKSTYSSKLVQCGQGYELTALAFDELEAGKPNNYIKNVSQKLSGKSPVLEQEFCKSFYEKMDDNECTRTSVALAPHKWWGQHWCYVSEACSVKVPLLNKRISYPLRHRSIEVPSTKVRVKVCEEKVDKFLSQKSPEELVAYGEKMGIWDPGFMLKVSYPAERRFFYQDRANHQAYFENLRINGTEPVVFDESNVFGAKIIISGNKTWRLPSALSYKGFSCVEGC